MSDINTARDQAAADCTSADRANGLMWTAVRAEITQALYGTVFIVAIPVKAATELTNQEKESGWPGFRDHFAVII